MTAISTYFKGGIPVLALLCGFFAGFVLAIRIFVLDDSFKNGHFLTNFCHQSKQRTQRLFGHVHIAKTGGTTLNGILAIKYERICGNKGYSYDYYQANKRFNITHVAWQQTQDSISNTASGLHNRGKVPIIIMDEIGYEDCDYVSSEANTKFWHRFGDWDMPMELHVPCRDPIDHLMSQCNYRYHKFNCRESISKEIPKCMVGHNFKRFNFDLTNNSIFRNIDIKCFDYKRTFNDYIDYIGNFLDSKKITSEYVIRDTNKKRNNADECVWMDPQIRTEIEHFMKNNYDYYSFCDSCLGSEGDLFGNPAKTASCRFS